jgi:large subunit ribosomal protein L16
MMILFPIKTKYKKSHKRNRILYKTEFLSNQPSLGFSGLKALSSFRATSKQIEAVRKVITKNIKKKYKSRLKFSIFPHLPITKKSSGIRMGKGKGNVEYWCFLIKKGKILFELNKKQVPMQKAFSCFSLASDKLPGKLLSIL